MLLDEADRTALRAEAAPNDEAEPRQGMHDLCVNRVVEPLLRRFLGARVAKAVHPLVLSSPLLRILQLERGGKLTRTLRKQRAQLAEVEAAETLITRSCAVLVDDGFRSALKLGDQLPQVTELQGHHGRPHNNLWFIS